MKLHEMTSRDDFPLFLNDAGLIGIGVEVGVFEGDYSNLLRMFWKGKLLIGVDPYLNQPETEYRDGCNRADLTEVKKRAFERLSILPGYEFRFVPSLEAVTEFQDGSLSFVYLDSNHRYESVQADLTAWWPKVKPGGVIGLHDFYARDSDSHLCNVPRAVWEFCYEKKLPWRVTACTSAWLQKQ